MALSVSSPTFSAFSFYSGSTPVIIGLVLAVLFGICVLGGGKRLTKVTEVLVPVMGILYVLVSLFVVITHIGALPHVFGMIFGSACGASAHDSDLPSHAVTGRFCGSALCAASYRGCQ